MKAFLLAAGLGTRLRPMTDHTPKCLLPIRGTPLLGIWLHHLAKCGVEEVLVNTHHLHEQVEQFSRNWTPPPKLRLSYEPVLLGSAGTLRANREFIQKDESFLVCYADNLTTFDVSLLWKALHARSKENSLGVMALFRSEEPWRCGIAALEEGGWVRKFQEKPKHPESNLANAGLYAFKREALELLPPDDPCDIGHDFIPRLLPKLIGLEMQTPILDIGTPQAYDRANQP